MIAVSSLRQKANCTPDIWRNQVNAKRTWEQAFERIYYFGQCEHELRSSKTLFVEPLGPDRDFPQIKFLVDWCSHQPSWACIINADIVIRVPQFRSVKYELSRVNAKSAMSWRFEFDPTIDVRTIQRVDLGLDIFCAVPEVWQLAYISIPEMFRIGCCLWDTWMMGFFNNYGGAWDFSEAKCILHPRHGDRKSPQQLIDSTYRDKHTKAAGMPRNKLRVT